LPYPNPSSYEGCGSIEEEEEEEGPIRMKLFGGITFETGFKWSPTQLQSMICPKEGTPDKQISTTGPKAQNDMVENNVHRVCSDSSSSIRVPW
jgi:hypothetical protein